MFRFVNNLLSPMKKMFALAVLSAALVGLIPATGLQAQTGPIQTGATASLAADAERVHLILMGFTTPQGNDIGPDCRMDLIAVQFKFARTFTSPQLRNRLIVHTLYGDNSSTAKVREYIRGLRLGTNDVVMAYHSGHGSITDPQRPVDTHLLQMGTREYMRRSELLQLLRATEAGGVILLTDCCSGIPKQLPASQTTPNAARGPAQSDNAGMNLQTVRNLVLRFRGCVDITAAQVGVNAKNGNKLNDYAGARGAFTAAFLSVISDTQAFTGWQDFYSALQDMTRKSSGGFHQAHANTINVGVVGHATTNATPASGSLTPPGMTGPIN